MPRSTPSWPATALLPQRRDAGDRRTRTPGTPGTDGQVVPERAPWTEPASSVNQPRPADRPRETANPARPASMHPRAEGGSEAPRSLGSRASTGWGLGCGCPGSLAGADGLPPGSARRGNRPASLTGLALGRPAEGGCTAGRNCGGSGFLQLIHRLSCSTMWTGWSDRAPVVAGRRHSRRTTRRLAGIRD